MPHEYAPALQNALAEIARIRLAIDYLPDFHPFTFDPTRQAVCHRALEEIEFHMCSVPTEIRRRNPAMQSFCHIPLGGPGYQILLWQTAISARDDLEPQIRAELERLGPASC